MKNHGFIHVGRDRRRLSPAFDMNPAPKRQRVLQSGILEGEPFEASLTIALDASGFFDIEREDAERMASRMAAIVNRGWREAFLAEGASTREIDAFAPAFQHEVMDQVLALT